MPRWTAACLLIALAACDNTTPANDVAAPVEPPPPIADNTPPPPPEPAPSTNTAADSAPYPDPPVVAGAVPPRFRGTYDTSAKDCDGPGSVYRLDVLANELHFHESVGKVRLVTPEGAGAVRIAADYTGEGESWSNSQRLALGEGGDRLTVTGDGGPTVRVRC